MRHHETIAETTGNLFGGKEPRPMAVQETRHSSATLADFIVPIVVTLLAMPVSITYSGDFYAFGGGNNFLQAITSSNIFLSLFVGSLTALVTTAVFYLIRGRITIATLGLSIKEAWALIQSSIILLLLAATFSNVIRYDLPAGAYLANLLVGSLSLWLLPVMFFAISVITSLATGSAWGTIAVMCPLALQMLITMMNVATPIAAEQVFLLFPVLGAVFSGAVAGTHISPIADNCVISTTSAGSYHIDHINAQTPYVIPSIIATGIAFLMVGLLDQWSEGAALGISLAVGLCCSFISLQMLSSFKKT